MKGRRIALLSTFSASDGTEVLTGADGFEVWKISMMSIIGVPIDGGSLVLDHCGGNNLARPCRSESIYGRLASSRHSGLAPAAPEADGLRPSPTCEIVRS